MPDRLNNRGERDEVERHRQQLAEQLGHTVSLEEAIEHWLAHNALEWRTRRQAAIMSRQREEIARHKWIESERAGKDLGREAALDWIYKYSARWRASFEQKLDGGPAGDPPR